MDTFLLITGFLLMIIGIVGSLIPVLPGPPTGWVGLLLLYMTRIVPDDWWVLGITLGFAITITVLDYVIPAMGTKKSGGTKYGMWGTTIGLLIGLISPIPLGFLIGAFIGAFVGEMIYDSQDTKRATKAAFGSFLGFLTSTFIKLTVSFIFLILFISKVWEYKSLFFSLYPEKI
jgi:uncharacterized protein YqgC (DUF456 family)